MKPAGARANERNESSTAPRLDTAPRTPLLLAALELCAIFPWQLLLHRPVQTTRYDHERRPPLDKGRRRRQSLARSLDHRLLPSLSL